MTPAECLDFDGVLHSYTSGWKGADVIPDPPVEGAIAFLREAVKHFQVEIFSSRSHQPGGGYAMRDWLLATYRRGRAGHLHARPAVVRRDWVAGREACRDGHDR